MHVLARPPLLVLALLPSWCQAQEASSIGYASVSAALAALQARPQLTPSQHDGWTRYTEEEGDSYTTWSFIPRSHPAYPALVRRDIIEKNGSPTLVTHLLCEGLTAECEKLYLRLKNASSAIGSELGSKELGR